MRSKVMRSRMIIRREPAADIDSHYGVVKGNGYAAGKGHLLSRGRSVTGKYDYLQGRNAQFWGAWLAGWRALP
jgi:hypothetical protein